MKSTGTVKWFANGYGFITGDADGKDIFVHYKGIFSDGFKNLEEGQKVQYDVEMGDRGLIAVNVLVIE